MKYTGGEGCKLLWCTVSGETSRCPVDLDETDGRCLLHIARRISVAVTALPATHGSSSRMHRLHSHLTNED